METYEQEQARQERVSEKDADDRLFLKENEMSKSCEICEHNLICELAGKIEDLNEPYFAGYSTGYVDTSEMHNDVMTAIARTCQFYNESADGSMTIEQAAIVVESLIGLKKFKLEVGEWYNPRKTTRHIYTDYDKDQCRLGFGDTWEECIEDLKKELDK